MGDSDLVLRDALAAVRAALKARGFSAKGTTFYRMVRDGNTISLSLQKSVKSSPAEARLTINYGVYSARVGQKLSEHRSSALDVAKAHWRKRLADEERREKWLLVKVTDNAEERARAILGAVDEILPELLDHSTDEALCASWLRGSSPGVGDMQRLLFLAILVSEVGPAEKLAGIVGELRSVVSGTVHEGLVERHLGKAGVLLP